MNEIIHKTVLSMQQAITISQYYGKFIALL